MPVLLKCISKISLLEIKLRNEFGIRGLLSSEWAEYVGGGENSSEKNKKS
jgi:hypothetical protein